MNFPKQPCLGCFCFGFEACFEAWGGVRYQQENQPNPKKGCLSHEK